MGNELQFPKLRYPIDIRVENIENQEVILISCPLGISQAPVVLLKAIGPVIACFEGNMSLQDILSKFSSYGLTKENLEQLVKLLDENLYLATARFFHAQKELQESYTNSPVRKAALAGRAYSGNKNDLENEIDRYLSLSKFESQSKAKKLCSIVAPHIDYRRGHITYGKTYPLLKDHQSDYYIVIGTSHQYSKGIFHLTTKDFDSPLGTLTNDKEFVKNLAAGYGEKRSFVDEILHKQEHSLELQMPFLKRLVKEPTIVPILVGSFHQMLLDKRYPEEYEYYDKFVESLVRNIRKLIENGKSLCIIAGVDMAHVGRQFGDKDKLTPEFMQQIEARDKQYLEVLANQDKKGLFNHIAEDMDARRICGFPTMYTVLDCFDRLNIKYSSELYEYRQAVDYATDCAVTFAGMGFFY